MPEPTEHPLTASQKAELLALWGASQPVELGPLMQAPAGKPATMRIYGPISSIGAPYAVSSSDVAKALDEIPEDVDTIEVHLHSPGGTAFEGTAIKNQLQQHPAKVNVIVDGLAASAASMVAMAGDTVSMAPSAQMMVHDASALCVGQADDMRLAADMLDKLSESYAQAYAAKAGGTAAAWRDAMQPETWYTAQEAVDAGLADRVLPKKQAAEPKTLFDLSIFAHAGREHAPDPVFPAKASNLPAEPPEKHPPIKEAVTMTPEQIKALRERLSLPDDADEATVQAKLVEHTLTEPEPPAPPEITDETIAAHYGVDAEKIRAAVDTVKGDKVTLSQVAFDELKAMASEGREARAKQREQERDEAIDAAFKAGKISAERRDAWRNAWDKDPEGTAKDLTSLEARFPVGQPTGYAGTDGTDGDGVKPFTDEEAGQLAALGGVSKEALLNG